MGKASFAKSLQRNLVFLHVAYMLRELAKNILVIISWKYARWSLLPLVVPAAAAGFVWLGSEI